MDLPVAGRCATTSRACGRGRTDRGTATATAGASPTSAGTSPWSRRTACRVGAASCVLGAARLSWGRTPVLGPPGPAQRCKAALLTHHGKHAGLDGAKYAWTLLPNKPPDGKSLFVPWLKSKLDRLTEPYKPKYDPKLPEPAQVARLAYMARRLALRCLQDVDEAALAPGNTAWQDPEVQAALNPTASLYNVRAGLAKAVAIATGGRWACGGRPCAPGELTHAAYTREHQTNFPHPASAGAPPWRGGRATMPATSWRSSPGWLTWARRSWSTCCLWAAHTLPIGQMSSQRGRPRWMRSCSREVPRSVGGAWCWTSRRCSCSSPASPRTALPCRNSPATSLAWSRR